MKTDSYKTKDLPESGYLLTQGVELLGIENENGTCWFIFRDKNDSKELVHDFWNGEAVVPARKYFESLQSLKSRIFALKRKVYENRNPSIT